MRDATGGVEFRGTDIDITIEKGRVSLAGGGQVTGKDGTLTIRSANRPPVIGDLDIDIAGEAAPWRSSPRRSRSTPCAMSG